MLEAGFGALRTRLQLHGALTMERWRFAAHTPAHVRLVLAAMGEPARDPDVPNVMKQPVRLTVEALDENGLPITNAKLEAEDVMRIANGAVARPALELPARWE
jgi:hypothetical protein